MPYPLIRRCTVAGVATLAALTLATGAAYPEQPPLRTTFGDRHHDRCGPVDCDMRARIASVDTYLRTRPGIVGYVLRDRVTGGVHANAHANASIWTASTIKLGMAADLLARNRAGAIRLSPDDFTRIHRMLNVSDDTATDTLWHAFSGFDHQAFNNAFRAWGMGGVVPQAGFSQVFPYWGFQKCTPHDLDRLMDFVLNRTHPDDRRYLLHEMRTVDPIQHWGVWGAGASMRPGDKNGWSEEKGGWVVNSVGFAGPHERYTLSIMNGLNGKGVFNDGSATVTQVARLLLAGRG